MLSWMDCLPVNRLKNRLHRVNTAYRDACQIRSNVLESSSLTLCIDKRLDAWSKGAAAHPRMADVLRWTSLAAVSWHRDIPLDETTAPRSMRIVQRCPKFTVKIVDTHINFSVASYCALRLLWRLYRSRLQKGPL